MNIGHLVQYALWKNDKTVNWLADQLSMTRATASAIANDDRKGLIRIDELSNIFGVSTIEFIKYSEEYDESMNADKRWFGRGKD